MHIYKYALSPSTQKILAQNFAIFKQIKQKNELRIYFRVRFFHLCYTIGTNCLFHKPRMMFSGKHFGKKKLLVSYHLGKSFLRYIYRAHKVIYDFDFLPRLRIPFLFGNLYSVHERIDYFLIEFVELCVLIQKP